MVNFHIILLGLIFEQSLETFNSASGHSEYNPSENPILDQWDQTGGFLKVIGNKFAHKSSPKRLMTFGLSRNRSIYVKKNLLWIYLGNFWKHLGNFFYLNIWSLCLGSSWTSLFGCRKTWLSIRWLETCTSQTPAFASSGSAPSTAGRAKTSSPKTSINPADLLSTQQKVLSIFCIEIVLTPRERILGQGCSGQQ